MFYSYAAFPAFILVFDIEIDCTFLFICFPFIKDTITFLLYFSFAHLLCIGHSLLQWDYYLSVWHLDWGSSSSLIYQHAVLSWVSEYTFNYLFSGLKEGNRGIMVVSNLGLQCIIEHGFKALFINLRILGKNSIQLKLLLEKVQVSLILFPAFLYRICYV